MTRVSIIIPTLNEENYIEKCLKSLLSQNFDSYEIIVVDGGSKDKTVSIAEEYADRVFVVEEDGIAFARLYGARKSKGKYIYTTDADCLSKNDSLIKNFYKELDIRKRTVAISGITKFTSLKGKLLQYWYYIYGRYISLIQLGVISLNGQNSIIKTKPLLECMKTNRKLPLFMDDNFFSMYLKKYGRIIHLTSDDFANYGDDRRVRNIPFALKSLYRYAIGVEQLRKYGTVKIKMIR